MIVNNKYKMIGLYKNNDLPTTVTFIIKLWKKKVTNLVILDETIKSSSKKYDEMVYLLKPPYRRQPKKKIIRWEFTVFLINLYSMVQFSRCQSQSQPIPELVQDVKFKQKSSINIHFKSGVLDGCYLLVCF